MTINPTRFFAMVACASAIAGCKTPQAALDQANNGAALTLSLQAQMAALHGTQATIAKNRIESIRRLNARVLNYKVASAFDDRVRMTASGSAEAQLERDLRALADSLAQDHSELARSLASLDANMSSLLQSVPVQTAQLSATQKAMAALGQESSLQHRVQVIAEFATTVKKTIDKNMEKSDAAAGSAPTSDLQAKPGSAPGNAN